jgi:fermentation-respiration switch protein FrsA (DUF1100 family)
MTTVAKICCGAILIYVAYCGFLYLMQRQLMFPRFLVGSGNSLPPADKVVEVVWLKTRQGKVEAWLMPVAAAQAQPAPVVIFAHGNAELIDFWVEPFQPFNRMGISVLLVEYPGYGRSEGGPSQASITETFTAAYDWLRERKDIDPNRIVLMGRSIGGGAICRLAAKRPSAALVLMSTFTNARFFARYYLAPGLLMRDPFDNLEVVRNYTRPILIIHGKHDEVVPYSHGVRLAQEAPNGKLVAYNSGHNDCPPDWSVFWKDIHEFFKTVGILSLSPGMRK